MNESLVSLLFLGTPSNSEGFICRHVGFLEKSNANLDRYLDIEASLLPKDPLSEVFRIVRVPFGERKLTIFLSYRSINPNDSINNRGAFFACGVAVLGDLDSKSSLSIVNYVSETHGYMGVFFDFEKNAFKKDFNINSFRIKNTPSLQGIKPENDDLLFRSQSAKKSIIISEEGSKSISEILYLVNRNRVDEAGNDGLDLVVTEDLYVSSSRRKIIISKPFHEVPITRDPSKVKENDDASSTILANENLKLQQENSKLKRVLKESMSQPRSERTRIQANSTENMKEHASEKKHPSKSKKPYLKYILFGIAMLMGILLMTTLFLYIASPKVKKVRTVVQPEQSGQLRKSCGDETYTKILKTITSDSILMIKSIGSNACYNVCQETVSSNTCEDCIIAESKNCSSDLNTG